MKELKASQSETVSADKTQQRTLAPLESHPKETQKQNSKTSISKPNSELPAGCGRHLRCRGLLKWRDGRG